MGLSTEISLRRKFIAAGGAGVLLTLTGCSLVTDPGSWSDEVSENAVVQVWAQNYADRTAQAVAHPPQIKKKDKVPGGLYQRTDRTNPAESGKGFVRTITYQKTIGKHVLGATAIIRGSSASEVDPYNVDTVVLKRECFDPKARNIANSCPDGEVLTLSYARSADESGYESPGSNGWSLTRGDEQFMSLAEKPELDALANEVLGTSPVG